MDEEVTQWESSFLESLLHQRFPLTAKQHAVLVRVAKVCCLTHCWREELRGQQRLFA